MTNVFLTAIGGDIAQSIAKIIRSKFPEWKIIGSDINLRHSGSLFVDKFVTAPLATNKNYYSWVKEQISDNNINLIFPLSEAEINFFNTKNLDINSGTHLIGASEDIIEIGRDKFKTAEFIGSIGLAAPWTILSEELKSIPSFPCIIKPRKGQGAKNVFICNNPNEARFFSRYISDAIFQEYLTPEDMEVTCALYRFKDGQLAILQLLRNLVGGATAWAKVINDADVQGQCEAIANKLDFYGPANIQLRLTKNGPRIFEINPRFSSTVLMRHRLGFTDVLWSLQEYLNIQPTKQVPSIDQIIVKTHDVSILD